MNLNMASNSSGEPASSLDEEARAWVRRLQSGQARGRDARLLSDWCARSAAHREAFARARQEWRDIGAVALTHGRLFPGRRRAEGAVLAGVDPRRRRFLGAGLSAAGAAAVVAVVRPPLGLWPSWDEFAADYRTGVGEQSRVALSDAIDLTLNTRTSLSLRPAGTAEEGRRLRLIAGEVAVRRGPDAAPLTLDIEGAQVLPGVGSVELRRLADRCVVTCTEGSAVVLSDAGRLALRAGERVGVGASGVSRVATVDVAQAAAWHRGVVAFDNTPLSEAVEEINRYRAGRVVLTSNALARHRLSGHFRIDALDEAIGQIEVLFGARVTRLPAGLVMLG